jgi:hypothetical protein
LDDQASFPIENECSTASPSIGGRLTPQMPLSAFNGENMSGSWRLTVSDNAAQDTGSLFGWCLQFNSPPPTPIPATAPVVSTVTCNGATECALSLDESFEIEFSFTDVNHNATAWHITIVRDDNQRFDGGSGTISPPSAGGTIPVSYNPFTCSGGNCRQTDYDFQVVVTDDTGLSSQPVGVPVTVLGSSGP